MSGGAHALFFAEGLRGQEGFVFGSSSKVHQGGKGVLGVGGLQVVGDKWECWARNTSVTMHLSDHKLRGPLRRSKSRPL